MEASYNLLKAIFILHPKRKTIPSIKKFR